MKTLHVLQWPALALTVNLASECAGLMVQSLVMSFTAPTFNESGLAVAHAALMLAMCIINALAVILLVKRLGAALNKQSVYVVLMKPSHNAELKEVTNKNE